MTFVEWVVGSGLLVWRGLVKECQPVDFDDMHDEEGV